MNADDFRCRTQMLIGDEAINRLGSSHVAIFGIGGVGSFCVEALARAGVGALTLVDHDRICLTNLNRQIHATMQTLGQQKVDAMSERVRAINPSIFVRSTAEFYLPENGESFFQESWDFVVDAMDTVSAKIDLIVRCQDKGIPVISCMGAGNKLDPTRFEVADLYKTSVCPLARVMRHELKKRGVKQLKVVYSREKPKAPLAVSTEPSQRRSLPGSISFVPSVAGLILAGIVVKELAELDVSDN